MSSILRKFGGGASEPPRRQGPGSKTGNHKGWGPPSSVPETSCPQSVHSPPNRVCRQPAFTDAAVP